MPPIWEYGNMEGENLCGGMDKHASQEKVARHLKLANTTFSSL